MAKTAGLKQAERGLAGYSPGVIGTDGYALSANPLKPILSLNSAAACRYDAPEIDNLSYKDINFVYLPKSGEFVHNLPVRPGTNSYDNGIAATYMARTVHARDDFERAMELTSRKSYEGVADGINIGIANLGKRVIGTEFLVNGIPTYIISKHFTQKVNGEFNYIYNNDFILPEEQALIFRYSKAASNLHAFAHLFENADEHEAAGFTVNQLAKLPAADILEARARDSVLGSAIRFAKSVDKIYGARAKNRITKFNFTISDLEEMIGAKPIKEFDDYTEVYLKNDNDRAGRTYKNRGDIGFNKNTGDLEDKFDYILIMEDLNLGHLLHVNFGDTRESQIRDVEKILAQEKLVSAYDSARKGERARDSTIDYVEGLIGTEYEFLLPKDVVKAYKDRTSSNGKNGTKEGKGKNGVAKEGKNADKAASGKNSEGKAEAKGKAEGSAEDGEATESDSDGGTSEASGEE